MVLLWLFKEMPCHVGQNFACFFIFQVLPALHSLLLGSGREGLVFPGAGSRDVVNNNLRMSTLPLQCVWLYPLNVYFLLQTQNVPVRNKQCSVQPLLLRVRIPMNSSPEACRHYRACFSQWLPGQVSAACVLPAHPSSLTWCYRPLQGCHQQIDIQFHCTPLLFLGVRLGPVNGSLIFCLVSTCQAAGGFGPLI